MRKLLYSNISIRSSTVENNRYSWAIMNNYIFLYNPTRKQIAYFFDCWTQQIISDICVFLLIYWHLYCMCYVLWRHFYCKWEHDLFNVSLFAITTFSVEKFGMYRWIWANEHRRKIPLCRSPSPLHQSTSLVSMDWLVCNVKLSFLWNETKPKKLLSTKVRQCMGLVRS